MLGLQHPLAAGRSPTVNERILLHLRESGYQGGPQAPTGASQQGLSKALRLRLSHTSRALKALLVDGLVTELVGRIPGEARRRKVYSLTSSGSALAQSLSSQVGERVVVVSSGDGSTEMTLLEATRLPGGPHTLATLLTLLRPDGTLHLSDLSRGEERPGPVAFYRGRPALDVLVGRHHDEAAVAHWTSSGKSILLLSGLAGIGKSAMASGLLRSYPHPPHSFWYSFREYDTRMDFVAAMAGFLGALGKGELSSRASVTDRELEAIVARDLRDEDAILVLDDLDRAPTLGGVAAAFVYGAQEARSRVVLTACRPPPWYSSFVPDDATEVPLAGLALEDAVRLVPKGFPEEEALRIARLAGGNPRLIRLSVRQGEDGLAEIDPRHRALVRYLRGKASGR